MRNLITITIKHINTQDIILEALKNSGYDKDNYISVINNAIKNEKKLYIRYVDKNGACTNRIISPLEWDIVNQVFLAHCFLRNDNRQFYINRIQFMGDCKDEN